MLNIVKGGMPLADIRGIVYRTPEGKVAQTLPRMDFEDPNTLPFPAWDLLDLNYYRCLPVEPLRGCPFSCTFCFRALGKKARYKDPQRIVAEIRHNIERYGVTHQDLKCGTFPLSKPHARDVLQAIIDAKLKIRWIASTRVNTVDEDLLRLMKESGCDEISFGIESADPDILKQCGKGTSPELAERMIRAAKAMGFRMIELNFILGLPHETWETLNTTKRFVKRIRKYSTAANFSILTPFPATEVHRQALAGEDGLSLRSTDWTDYTKQAGTALNHANFKEGELVRFQAGLYLTYYLASPHKIIEFFTFRRAYGFLQKLFA